MKLFKARTAVAILLRFLTSMLQSRKERSASVAAAPSPEEEAASRASQELPAAKRGLGKERSFSFSLSSRSKDKTAAAPAPPPAAKADVRALARSESSAVPKTSSPGARRLSRLKTDGDIPEPSSERKAILQLKDFLRNNDFFEARLTELFGNAVFFRILLEFAQARYSSEVVLLWKEILLIQNQHRNALPLSELLQTFVLDSESAVLVTLPHDVVELCRSVAARNDDAASEQQLPMQLRDEAYALVHNLVDSFLAVYIND